MVTEPKPKVLAIEHPLEIASSSSNSSSEAEIVRPQRLSVRDFNFSSNESKKSTRSVSEVYPDKILSDDCEVIEPVAPKESIYLSKKFTEFNQKYLVDETNPLTTQFKKHLFARPPPVIEKQKLAPVQTAAPVK